MLLRRVIDRNSRTYADAIAILREAILREAQLPEQRFQDLFDSGDYRLFAYADGDDVQGVALVYFSHELRFAWLDYFAIRTDLRGKGLGTQLFGEIVKVAASEKPAPEWVLFEVDDDYEGDPQREAECNRRVAFYRRLGARVLENVPYKFPSAVAEPIPMRLMAYELRSDDSLSPDYLSRAVREVFLNIHGRAIDDPLLGWFEGNLPGSIRAR